MEINNRPIYLPIRSLGDFVITACIIKSFSKEKVPVILPRYLLDLFVAMQAEQYFDLVGTIDYKNQPVFFEIYTIKNLKRFGQLLSDFYTLHKSLDRTLNYLLDERSRRLNFLFFKFDWQTSNQNRYLSKFELFSKTFKFSETEYKIPVIKRPSSGRIVIFPDSRVKDKEIGALLIEMIKKNLNEEKVFVAHFEKKKASEGGVLYYSNFDELMDIINNSTFVITADSLPCHLAFFLNIPHFVIYNQESRFSNEHFRTPYMVHNNYFCLANEQNHLEVVEQLSSILKN